MLANAAWLRRINKKHINVLIYTVSIAALVIALLARLTAIIEKRTIWDDEANTYLSATGHQGSYYQIGGTRTDAKDEPPAGTWNHTSDWLPLIQPERPFVFRQITFDASHYDIHPPGYFWLLHVWITITRGTPPAVGPALNVLLEVFTAIVLFRFMQTYLQSRVAALAVVAIWALSPIPLYATLSARSYPLFTLLSVLFAYALFLTYMRPVTFKANSLENIGILILAAAGMLTHYYFAFVIASGVAVVAIVFWRTDRKRIAALLALLALAAALVLVADRFYFYSVQFNRVDIEYTFENPPTRLFIAGRTALRMMIPVGFALILFGLGRLLTSEHHQQQHSRLFLPILTLGIGGGSIALYALGFGPLVYFWSHRYVAPIWPFFVIVAVWIVMMSSKERLQASLLLILSLGLIGFQTLRMLPPVIQTLTNNEPLDELLPAYHDNIVVDNQSQAVALPLILQLPESSRLFIAPQNLLTSEPDRWLPQLAQSGGLYIHAPRSNSTFAGGSEILEMIESSGAVYHQIITPTLWQADTTLFVYQVEPAPDLSRAQLTNWTLDDTIALVGYRLEQGGEQTDTLVAGQNATIILYWQAIATPPADYIAFAHLVDGSSNIVAQNDVQPMHGYIPTSTWNSDQIYTSVHPFVVGQDAPPGQYQFFVGMYNWPAIERLVVAGDSQIPEDRRIPLMTLMIESR